MIEGIDVSGYQSTNYSTAGQSFVVVKATEGTSYINPRYSAQLTTARKAGCVVGHYHFQHHGNAAAEAAYFLKNVDLRPNEFIALDWEQHGDTTADKDAWMKAVKAHYPHYKVILYTFTSMWKGVDTDSFVQDGLWIADPNHPKGKPGVTHAWLFHQYSSAGGVDHNVGNFDSKSALLKWCGEDAPHAHPTTPPVKPAPKPKPKPVYAPFPGASFFHIGRTSGLITALGKRLVAEGWKGYKMGPGPVFTRNDIKAIAWYQRKQGWTGADANGIPGKETWARLKVPKS